MERAYNITDGGKVEVRYAKLEVDAALFRVVYCFLQLDRKHSLPLHVERIALRDCLLKHKTGCFCLSQKHHERAKYFQGVSNSAQFSPPRRIL